MKARSYVHVGFKKKILSALIYTVDTICEITCNGIFFIIMSLLKCAFLINRVLSCLMENLHTDNMIPECEEQLLHLEFFIARDIE